MKKQLFLFLLFTLFVGCKKEKEEEVKPNAKVVKACFGYEPNVFNDGEVQFTNCSENAVSFLWDFGDGDTSSKKEPLHVFSGEFPFSVKLIAYNDKETDTVMKLVYDAILVKKPNIYIYPVSILDLCLRVSFPMGGNIIESIPNYIDGWCFNVDKTGRIDNQYNYIFYESKQPDVFQYKQGWCVAKTDLKSFFEKNMAHYNFSTSEIKDYLDYWIPLLNDKDYYCIFPQTNKIIDRIIQLSFSVNPDHIYRIFYGVVGTNEYSKIIEPEIKPFNRSGFYVIEWGVFRK